MLTYTFRTILRKYSSIFPRCQRRFLQRTLVLAKREPMIMNIDSNEFHAMFTPELRTLAGLFEKYEHELRIAGGAVRDLLLHKQPHDLDFASTATPDQMMHMFEKEKIRTINTNGISHGTVTCRINDKENFEVTTLRIDVVTDGRRAQVQFTKDWLLDSERRDLTVNSLFLGLDGTVYDYFGGIKDLEEKRVRFVGDAVKRIQEDYLRILRYFRFYGRISEQADVHDKDTLTAIRDNGSGLARISGERIWMELKKILSGNHAASILQRILDLDLGQYIGVHDDLNVHRMTEVWDRCHHLEPHYMVILSALMCTEDQMYQLNDRLRMSRDELFLGLFLIKHREDPELRTEPLQHCQHLVCDTAGQEGKVKDACRELLKHLNRSDVITEFDQWELPRFPVTGLSIINTGVHKGPRVAKLLAALREIWKKSGFTLDQEELLDHLEDAKKKVR